MAREKKKSKQTHSNNQKGAGNAQKGQKDSIGEFGKLLQKARIKDSILGKGKDDKLKNSQNKEDESPRKQGSETVDVLSTKSTATDVSDDNDWGKVKGDAGIEINLVDGSTPKPASPCDVRTVTEEPELFFDDQLTNSASEESELIIGLDFGTSCTKAVIRDNSQKKSYAVPFHEEFPYLMSTELLVNNSGTCGLTAGLVTGDELINDIKLNLMDAPDAEIFKENETGNKVTAKELSVAYVALILREIRCWFFKEHGEKYKNRELLWELNIGLPSRSYDDQNMCNVFKVVALAAWNLSVQDTRVTLDLAQVAFCKSKNDIDSFPTDNELLINIPNLHPDSVNVIPEVIAEIVGYDKSRMRQDGLHLLVDIGAGTIDVTSFIIDSSLSGRFNLLTTEVKMYGAFKLHAHRLSNVKSLIEKKLNRLSQSTNGMSPLPPIDQYSVSREELNAIDKEFMSKFRNVLGRVISATKNKRDPMSPKWKDGLPVFVCGGGSLVELYKDSIEYCLQQFSQQHATIEKFNLLDIPKPDDLEAPSLDKKNYHRVAVAYGLSFTFLDIKEVVPPRGIEDHELQIRNQGYRDNFISPDMV